jgi:hypothetical protein
VESIDEKESKRKGAREMRIAGLVIGLSMLLALVVAALIVVLGHVRLF